MRRINALEILESRTCLTAISFTPHEIAAADLAEPSLAMATDMDGDGDMDFLFANDRDIGWYENIGGRYGDIHVIDENAAGFPNRFHRHDLNSDGLLDLQVSNYSGVVLYETGQRPFVQSSSVHRNQKRQFR